MTSLATKFRAGTAAVAIAAAATLTPIAPAQAEPAVPAPASPVITQVLATNSPLIGSDMIKMQLTCGLLGLICAGNRTDLSPHQLIFDVPFLGFLLGDFAICTLGFSVKQGAYGSLSISRGSSC